MSMSKGQASPIPFTLHPFHFSFQLEKLVLKETHEPFGQLNVSQHASCFAESYEGPIKASHGTGVLLKGLRKIQG